MNGIYFLTIVGGEDSSSGELNIFKQTDTFNSLVIIPYNNGIKDNIYIKIRYTELNIFINNIKFSYDDEKIVLMSLQEFYNYYQLLNPVKVNKENIMKFAYIPRHYRIIDVIQNEHLFRFINENLFSITNKKEKEKPELIFILKIFQDSYDDDNKIENKFHYLFFDYSIINYNDIIKLNNLYPNNINIFDCTIYFINDPIYGLKITNLVYKKNNLYYKPLIKMYEF